jgi:hypothetical protein
MVLFTYRLISNSELLVERILLFDYDEKNLILNIYIGQRSNFYDLRGSGIEEEVGLRTTTKL